MKRAVIDASVVAKWFLPEPDSAAAARWLSGEYRLLAPDLLRAELGNIFWKHWRRGVLDRDTVGSMLEDFGRSPIKIIDSRHLMAAAWSAASVFDVTFYDGLYVGLAMTSEAQLVTADRRLYEKVSGAAGMPAARWVDR